MSKRTISSTLEAHELLADAQIMRACATDQFTLQKAESMEQAAREYLALPEKPQLGTGGEVIPQGQDDIDYPGIAGMTREPDLTTAQASRERLRLADEAGCFHAAADAAESAGVQDSLEKMLCHQLAAAHVATMKLLGRSADEIGQANRFSGFEHQQACKAQAARLAGAAARLMSSYQQGMLALQKRRTGGRQTVTVVHQHVNVAAGAQAAVAGAVANRGDYDGE